MQQGTGTPSGAVLVGVAAALLTVLAVATAAGGPVEFGEPRLPIGVEGSGERLGDLAELGEEPQGQDPAVDADETPWALIVIAVVATALAAMLVRTLRLGRDADARDSPTAPALPDVSDPGGSALTAVRRAARTGSARLAAAEPRQARDAVVGAWLALEQAAAAGGTARQPAQTPTEFTVALLRAHDADERATADLLALYHQARFGAEPLAADAGTRAAAALETIAAGLEGARRG